MALPITEWPSPNHNARDPRLPVDILLLHYTGMVDAETALARMCDPAAKVSAHYCIDEDGGLLRLVPEARRAWHAGVARWGGASDINGRSIGIELVNPGHQWGYRDFPEAQMQSLIALALDILQRHPIPPARVLGHSDVAPGRRQDPGELFDWARLARSGIGLWPDAGEVGEAAEALDPTAPLAPTTLAEGLEAFGYGLDEAPLESVIAAFQRHYRPSLIDGVADRGTCACLAGLLSLLDVTEAGA